MFLGLGGLVYRYSEGNVIQPEQATANAPADLVEIVLPQVLSANASIGKTAFDLLSALSFAQL